MHKASWIAGVAAVLIALVAWSFLAGVTDVTATSLRVTGVRNATLSSVTLDGVVTLRNPSRVTIPLTSGAYAMRLDRTGDTLATGTLAPADLAPKTTTELPLTMTIPASALSPLLSDIARERQVNATIAGTATVEVIGVSFDVPFSSRVDLAKALDGVLPERVRGALDIVRGIFG